MSGQQATRVAELGDLVPKLAEDAGGRHRDHVQELLKELASPNLTGSIAWTGEPEPTSGLWQANFGAPAHTCVVQLPGKNVGVLKMAKGGRFTLFVRFKNSLLKAWAKTHGQNGVGRRVFRRSVDPEQAIQMLASARVFHLKEGEVHHPYALAILCTMSRVKWLIPPPSVNRFDVPNKKNLHLTLVAVPPLDPVLEQCLCLIGRKDTFFGVGDDDVPSSGQVAVDARVWGKTHQSMVSGATSALMSRAARDLVDHADVTIFTKCIPALNRTAADTKCFLDTAVICLTKAPAPAAAAPAAAPPAAAPQRARPPNGRRSGMVASDDDSDEDSPVEGIPPAAPPAPAPAPPAPAPALAPAPEATANSSRPQKRRKANNDGSDDDDDTERIAEADKELDEVEDESESDDDSSASDSSGAPRNRNKRRRAARSSSDESGSDESGESEDESGDDADADAGAAVQSGAPPPAPPQPPPAPPPAPAAAPTTEALVDLVERTMLETMMRQTGPWATRMREWVRTHQSTSDPSRMQRIVKDVEELAKPASPAGMIASALSLTTALAELHSDRLTGATLTISSETQQRMSALTWKAKEFSATTVEHMSEVFRRLEEVQAQARGVLECVANGNGASRAQQASAPAH